MIAEIVVSFNTPAAAADILGLESFAPEAKITRIAGDNGKSVTFRMSGSTWDRIRPQLRKLAARRIPVVVNSAMTGKTMPALTYTLAWIPSGRPRIHQVEGTVSVGGGAALTVRGENFLAGLQAALNVYRQRVSAGNFAAAGDWNNPTWIDQELLLTITAVQKGPIGNNISVYIGAASGAGSVTVVENPDGAVQISVIPAAGSDDTTSIAAQIAGSTLASVWITATAVIASQKVAPFAGNEIVGPNATPGTPYRFLTGGDGGGIAFADLLVSGTDPTNRSRVQAQRAGNQGNMVSIEIRVSQGADAVTVTGNDILVTRTAATLTLAQLKTALDGNASALALVNTTTVGAGSLGAVAKTYLNGGAGEQPTAQLGGATATITSMSDTVMTVTATAGALTGAGVAATEVAMLNLMLDYQRLQASMVAAA
jgi:hypothetical protein